MIYLLALAGMTYTGYALGGIIGLLVGAVLWFWLMCKADDDPTC